MSGEELRAEEGVKAPMHEVPGVLRLGWMLFMQPIKLERHFAAFGEARLTLPRLWRKAKEDGGWARAVLKSSGLVALTWLPAIVLPCTAALYSLGGTVSWSKACAGVLLGVAVSCVGSLGDITQALRLGLAVALGFSLFGAVEIRDASVWGIALWGLLVAIAFRTLVSSAPARLEALTTAGRVRQTVTIVLAMMSGLLGRACGAGQPLMTVLREGAWWFTGVSVVVGIVFVQFHTYVLECLWMSCLSVAVRLRADVAPRLARALPFRHHDLIFFPLPGLRSFIVTLDDQDSVLARTLIDEALDSTAQKTPALDALAELIARPLERAAHARTWALAAAFLPRPEDASETTSPLHRFCAIAHDLVAARLTTDHLRRRNLLARARSTLKGVRVALASKRRPDPLERRLLPTSRLWLDVIDDEVQALATLEREHPQIPTPFEPGPPLRPEDANLFKGRVDLIRFIDHDLADHRRAPLLLTGQRRMGKTSLLYMLPDRLGTGTLVLPLNFQSLSGNPHKADPHRWLAEAMAAARPDLPSPPTTTPWADTLAWLQSIEPALGKDRVLVALDEIERLQTGIEEGWTTPAFLDFLRAAGDSLRKIRLLLVSAHPLHRLGRTWTDRLISVIHREIGYLAPHEAEELITHPMDGFPDIYPPGGVARIAGETRGHPYLIQLVCDALVRDLNGRGKLTAENADITRALDRALGDTPLFRELWSDRNDGERAILRDLTKEPGPLGDREAEARDLLHEGLIEKDGERYRVAVPLFAAWIRERA